MSKTIGLEVYSSMYRTSQLQGTHKGISRKLIQSSSNYFLHIVRYGEPICILPDDGVRTHIYLPGGRRNDDSTFPVLVWNSNVYGNQRMCGTFLSTAVLLSMPTAGQRSPNGCVLACFLITVYEYRGLGEEHCSGSSFISVLMFHKTYSEVYLHNILIDCPALIDPE